MYWGVMISNSPGHTDFATPISLHHPPRSARMEASIMNAMIESIFKEGLEDKGFIEERTEV